MSSSVSRCSDLTVSFTPLHKFTFFVIHVCTILYVHGAQTSIYIYAADTNYVGYCTIANFRLAVPITAFFQSDLGLTGKAQNNAPIRGGDGGGDFVEEKVLP